MNESIPRRIWRIIYPGLLLFGIYLLVYLGAMLVYDSFFRNSYENVDVFMASWSTLVSTIALAVGAVIVYVIYLRDNHDYSPYITKHWAYFIPAAFLGICASIALSALVTLINIDGIIGNYSEIGERIFSTDIIWIFMSSCVFAPIAEELTFRGLVFNRAKNWLGFWPAAIISSVLFGIYHFNLAQGLYACLFAMVICLVYNKFRNLWVAIAMHAAANIYTVISQYISSEIMYVWQILLLMIITGLSGAAIYIFIIRKVDINS